MKKAKNITASIDLHDITPTADRTLLKIKAWPAQNDAGIFSLEAATVIRNEMYVAEAITSTKYGEGDILITSMYSGYHVATKAEHAKIIWHSDVLMYKSKKEMDKNLSFEPETFTPGLDYILVKIKNKTEVTTDGGIIVDIEGSGEQSKNDSITKLAEVVSIGEMKEAKTGYSVKIGDKIIIDSFVGLPMNQNNTKPEYEYRIMYHFDILGFIKE